MAGPERADATIKTATGSAAGGVAGAGASGGAGAAGDRAAKAIGLTADGRSLVSFRTDRPARTSGLGALTGLKGDQKLIGIDYRVQNNTLYGVGDLGGIYILREQGARATKVSQLTVALQGQNFGVDFNPAANRLRVISDTGQNLRHNLDDPNGAPAAGTTAVDGTLTNPPVPPAPGATALGVTAAAYTNNDLDAATGTTLFDLDSALDQISVQSPANNGSLAPTGKLGTDAAADSGLDILSSSADGSNTAFATTQNRLFRINLLTGKATSLGAFPEGRQVTDLALPLNQD
ncbi:DUF4394 domain-containing protein [Streptomyces monticola]|uniref:DUF4394 domain-containing protein n=1 Tax=Streptomyces monticola TaxID=2666263 RepID=A0ABW2JJ25_9ACTN